MYTLYFDIQSFVDSFQHYFLNYKIIFILPSHRQLTVMDLRHIFFFLFFFSNQKLGQGKKKSKDLLYMIKLSRNVLFLEKKLFICWAFETKSMSLWSWEAWVWTQGQGPHLWALLPGQQLSGPGLPSITYCRNSEQSHNLQARSRLYTVEKITWAPPISQGWCKRQNLWSSPQLHLWNATLTTRRALSLSPPILWHHWLFLILHLRVLISKLCFREKHKTLPLTLPTMEGGGRKGRSPLQSSLAWPPSPK